MHIVAIASLVLGASGASAMTLVHRDNSVARNDMPIVRSSSDDFTGGHATYFDQGGIPGACGAVHSNNDFIAAISLTRWGSYPSGSSPNCGRSIVVTNTNNGKTAIVVVADLCPGCGENDLDLSLGAFSLIDDSSQGLADGILPIVWQYDD
uniref:N/A n=1 Tax=Ganoderma boninense TaxID=34458 RepID=A0A5K1JU36_9APHY|nr:N/A [Ganoderma boninense]